MADARLKWSSVVPFLRASSLHIGAAAATASLREELVRTGRLTPYEIDAAYSVSRVTPGTNLLALYAALGHRLVGWSLALAAVVVGALVPATIALIVAVLYTHLSSPFVADLMSGARAGGVAVFLGAAVRLLKPQLIAHPGPALAFVIVVGVGAATRTVGPFPVLLVAGAVGAALLRPR